VKWPALQWNGWIAVGFERWIFTVQSSGQAGQAEKDPPPDSRSWR
jgi:hypothetical protein